MRSPGRFPSGAKGSFGAARRSGSCSRPSLLVLALREVEFAPRRASGGLALLVGRLRLLQAVPFLPQAIEVLDFLLEGRPLRLEFRGDLTLVSNFRLAGLEGSQPRRTILE